MLNKRRGRPAGGSDARQRLLAAAREAFTRDGYPGATLRVIAGAAGVDVALVRYHFGSKEGLFVESMALAFDPAQVLSTAFEGAGGDAADRLLTGVLKSWEDPDRQEAMRTFVMTAFQRPEILRAFGEYIEREVLAKAANSITGAHATRRAVAAITIVMGLIFNRYILQLAPASAMSAPEIHGALAPALRAALGARR